MLAVLAFVAILDVWGLYLVYKVHRSSEKIEALTATAYLEARKALSQSK